MMPCCKPSNLGTSKLSLGIFRNTFVPEEDWDSFPLLRAWWVLPPGVWVSPNCWYPGTSWLPALAWQAEGTHCSECHDVYLRISNYLDTWKGLNYLVSLCELGSGDTARQGTVSCHPTSSIPWTCYWLVEGQWPHVPLCSDTSSAQFYPGSWMSKCKIPENRHERDLERLAQPMFPFHSTRISKMWLSLCRGMFPNLPQ